MTGLNKRVDNGGLRDCLGCINVEHVYGERKRERFSLAFFWFHLVISNAIFLANTTMLRPQSSHINVFDSQVDGPEKEVKNLIYLSVQIWLVLVLNCFEVW